MASSCNVFSSGILYADFTCFICLLLMLVLPITNSLHFKVSRFDSEAKDIVYRGDAEPSFGAVDLNKVGVYCCRVGQVLYNEKVPIWDSNSGKVTDFVTRFSFVIDTQGLGPGSYGNGLAFFLAPVGFTSPLNSAAGFLGLFNTTTIDGSSQTPMIVVEFDSFSNSDWDPPFEHVGINKNSLSSLNLAPWNASLHSKETTNAWVSYNATTKNLSVFWTYERNPNFQGNSTLSYQIDLREVLPSWVTIGISASTGRYIERNTIQDWEFSSNLDIKEKTEEAPKKVKLAVGLAVPLGVLLAGAMVAYAIWLRRHRRSIGETLGTVTLTSMNDDLERGAGPKRFSYSDLASATNNFSNDRKLGEGGFGCVYKGYLSREGLVVAVKKISQGSKQGKKEYITEVKIISSLRHRNLVQLIGWCHDQTQFLLVYEFMPNGSLDSHLFGKKHSLEWGVRYRIATGLASALLYLHEEWEQCVVHRDIKTSNIMLDLGFNVKLGDFGLARLMDHELGPQTTGLAGTLGYLAPEYVTTGKASKESDVYSFGVVALEIACGRKAMDSVDPNSDLGLVQWAWGLFGKGELVSGVDQKLKKEYDAKQVECLMTVGLWCAHPDRSLRPSIRQAIQVLKFEGAAPSLPTKMPVPVYYTAPDDPEVSSGGSGGGSITYTSSDLVR